MAPRPPDCRTLGNSLTVSATTETPTICAPSVAGKGDQKGTKTNPTATVFITRMSYARYRFRPALQPLPMLGQLPAGTTTTETVTLVIDGSGSMEARNTGDSAF